MPCHQEIALSGFDLFPEDYHKFRVYHPQTVPLLPCIFGSIDKEDNLKHYLSCEPLWTLASSACGLPLPSSPSPLLIGFALPISLSLALSF